MLPYLAAIGLITTSDLSLTGSVAVLLSYCLVMVAPALVLLAARVLLHERLLAHPYPSRSVDVPQLPRNDPRGSCSSSGSTWPEARRPHSACDQLDQLIP